MKVFFTSVRWLAVFSILLGFVYPLVMTAVSQMAFPEKAGGSLLSPRRGTVVGSELIGQSFKSDRYFWSRPSAVDHNPMTSGGSNSGPISHDLIQKVEERKKQGMTGTLLFASASGLDPHIKRDDAYMQIERIAKTRNQLESTIKELVDSLVEARQWGFLGEERVNVLKLNLALDERFQP